MFASQSQLIAQTILCDMLNMSLCELVDSIIDDINASILPHALGRIIGVGSGSCSGRWVLQVTDIQMEN